jgi:hypothetical protein
VAITLSWAATLTAVETLTGNTDDAPDAQRKITHSGFDLSGQASATLAPVVTAHAGKLIALTAGALTIDLTSLAGWGSNGTTVNGTGLKVQFLRVKNLGANDMAFTTGATNGYNFGGTVTVHPGGFVMFGQNNGNPAIASGVKTIDVTGTGTQTAQVSIEMG